MQSVNNGELKLLNVGNAAIRLLVTQGKVAYG